MCTRASWRCRGRTERLSRQWEVFCSELMPGEKETWTAARVRAPTRSAPLPKWSATLYDVFLDQTYANWPQMFNVFGSESEWVQTEFQNADRDSSGSATRHTP